MKAIEEFRNGTVEYKKMQGEGSYFTFPCRENVKKFRKRGKK